MIRFTQIKLIAKHTLIGILKASINQWLIGAFLLLILIASVSSYLSNQEHQHHVDHYSQDVRDRWDSNPDKHPHRMAHYGYIAFRSKFPLSFFDNGIDSYFGNAVFLEAHRQNSVNFSRASQSSSLLRFGELSSGILLQLLLPLLIFFWGYGSISDERSNGILKLYLTQGAGWREIIIGKTLGLFMMSMTIVIPTFILTSILLFFSLQLFSSTLIWLHLFGLVISYLAFLFIMAFLAVWLSAKSSSSKSSLIMLIGLWLFFTLIFPRLSQVVGQYMYPVPSKVAFDSAVEQEIIKQGDSHNPDDPHYTALKDSLLMAYGVSSTDELPFNYSGFVMKEGEKLSTETFRRHQSELIELYEKQSQIVNYTALLNPYIAIKHISMTLSGTDFISYQAFNQAAEDYRYNLAQGMNDLQIEHISNTVKSSADKNAVISQEYWVDFLEFEHDFVTFQKSARSIFWSMCTLTLWLVGIGIFINFSSKNLKAI